MKKLLNKILVVDGSYCLHRSLKSHGLDELSTSQGVLSGGVFGTLRIILSECRKFSGYYPVICWDAGLSPRRTKIHPDYKHNIDRQARIDSGEVDPYIEEYRRQRGDLIEIFKALGIPSIRVYGWEGDDLMYLITTISNESVVLSDDKDMIQLLSPTVQIRRAMKGETLTYENTDQSYRYPWYCISKAIVGDPSDNIPQVAEGVGGKAAEFIAEYLHNKPRDEWKESLLKYEGKPGQVKKVLKVYDNFDQFNINFDLTDLTQVIPTDDIWMQIESSIKPVLGKANFFEAMKWASYYEITSIDFQSAMACIMPYANSVFINESEASNS